MIKVEPKALIRVIKKNISLPQSLVHGSSYFFSQEKLFGLGHLALFQIQWTDKNKKLIG